MPGSYAAIQDAIDAAADGDTICVAAGTYAENIDFSGKDVVVEGYDGAASTTIDGAGSGPVVTFAGGESPSAVLRGFTITGGDAAHGAGIYVYASDPSLEDLVVEGNTCTTSSGQCMGAGIYAENANLALADVVVQSNEAAPTASSSTASTYGVGIYLSSSYATLEDVDVLDNAHAPASASYVFTVGAGVALLYSDAEWRGGTVAGNLMNDGGGATTSGYGGGMYLYQSSLEGEHLVVADHEADLNYYGGGAGIALSYADLELSNAIIAGNTVRGGPGGTTSGIPSNAGGGLLVFFSSSAALENCDIVDNTAAPSSDGQGGGAYVSSSGDLTLVNTNVVGNEADDGGAIAIGSHMGWGGSLDASYSDFYDNGSDPFKGVSSPVGSDGNIADDPLYADTSAADAVDWDLTLDTASPCVDAGDPSITDPDGSTSDIGAYGGPGGSW